jgi:hypothetical protein
MDPTFESVRAISRLASACSAIALAACWLAPAGHASQLIARDARAVSLQVDARGRALVTYRAKGRTWHVLAWGAINARHPSRARSQVELRVDYSGGWRSFGRGMWRALENVCRPTSVRLAWLVAACRAPDGSFWALQSWQRRLPNYGLTATGIRASRELRLSHWRGPLPKLEVDTGWAYGRYHSLFGRYTYRGRPVYGFASTPSGRPLDTFGRNVYVDTYDSAYGAGWRRENGFLTHTGNGGFCYGFYPHNGRPSGMGTRYRATVSGPGVLPDVSWEGIAPGPYDRSYDRVADERQLALLGTDPLCSPR